MLHSVSALLAFAGLVLASQAVFSVHDDLLAFPQYEVEFPDSFISDIEAYDILSHTQPARVDYEEEAISDSKSISSHGNHGHRARENGAKYSYEWMYQDGKRYLCSIPVIKTPPRNETSEAEARAEEAQEIARATDRGWELLQELDAPCLYYVSGYWSYSFCHNSEVKQFRQLPQQQGRPAYPPTEDPNVNSFILGKSIDVVKSDSRSKQDEWGNEVEVRKSQKTSPPTTELQMEGDTRYLVQKLDGGTTCDLTGKPRRVEVQYHCNPNVGDRITRLKEFTTCAYLLTVHTPRLCKDMAFVPPIATAANSIECQRVVPQEEVANMHLSTLEAASQSIKEKEEEEETETETETKTEHGKQIVIGGIVVGGNKFVGKEGQKIALPAGLPILQNPAADIIAKAQGEADGGEVIVLSDEALVDMDLDPGIVQDLREKMKKMAGERGWTLELVEGPGNVKEIHGIVDGEDEDENDETETKSEKVEKQRSDDDGKDRKKRPVKEEL